MERHDGFIPLYLDEKQGKIFLEIPRDSTRALMFVSLATGLASNPITGDEQRRAHWTSIASDLNRWLERQELPSPTPALRAPPGDPFGMDM